MIELALALVLAQQPAKAVREMSGGDLYRAHCASCHGTAGRGDGPVAAGLKAKTPDLATLTKRNKGKFPQERVEAMILGDASAAASHGTRDMPVWGPAFSALDQDRDLSRVRVRNLSEFIRGMQVK